MSLLYLNRGILQNRIKNDQSKKIKRPSPIKKTGTEDHARDLLVFLNSSMHEDLLRDIKGISRFISFLNGSMTVEAAIILPLLLFFFLNLFSGIEMLRLHGNMQMAFWETGRQVSVYGYIYDQVLEEEQRNQTIAKMGGKVFSQFMIKSQILQYLGKAYLDETPLTFGADGLNFWESSIMGENNDVDIKITYQVSPWVNIVGFQTFRMSNRYFSHAWTGYEIAEQNQGDAGAQDYVYITEYGKVYHESLECSYIKRTIRNVPLSQVQFMFNRSGSPYTLCESCRNKPHGSAVYLTESGERYHYSLDCQALKRTIHTILRIEAQEQFEPCSRCGGNR